MHTVQKTINDLLSGNHRFVSGSNTHPNQSPERRQELAKGQNPKAIIVTCSDSRVVPEIIFDQGLGDLFVVRTAGHIVDDVAVASIEYAAHHLEVPLIVVMGHQYCGAVKAALEGAGGLGHLDCLIHPILQNIGQDSTKPEHARLDKTVRLNAKKITEQLKTSQPILAAMFEKGELSIVPAYYSIDSGVVDMEI